MLTLKIPTNIRSIFTLFYTNISLYSTFSTRIILNTLLFFTRILLSVVLPPSFVDTKMYQTVNVCVHGSYSLTIGFHLPCLQLLCDITLHVNYEFLFIQKQSYIFSTISTSIYYTFSTVYSHY